MYFNVFNIIIIVLYQCLMTCPSKIDLHEYIKKKPGCNIPVSPTDFKLPIPYQRIIRPYILRPNTNGILHFESNATIQLSCAYNAFQLEILKGLRETTVVCLSGDRVSHKGKSYKYYDFRCQSIPLPKLIKTSHRCQNNATIATVGFQTIYKFLILYHICFDTININTLYSWYFAASPHYSNRLSHQERPIFIKSKQFFEEMDMNTLYKTQSTMVSKTLRSEELAEKYIDNETEYFLARGHLVARTEFAFGFEQEATFFYENTVPTWQIFNNNIWKRVEAYISQQLAIGTAKHLVIAGTFGVCTLPDVDNIERPLYLSYPDRIPVPLFIWKLVINQNTKNGFVYVGLNNPYIKMNVSSYMCEPLPCPKEINITLEIAHANNEGLVYCCTKRSFEKGYGERLHPIIFHRNLV